MEEAAHEKAVLALFPELGLSAYSCDDLFHQRALLDGALEALRLVLKSSEALNLIAVVGLPLKIDHLLFNCAVIVQRGKILGIVAKTFLPNYREFYESRQFAPAAAAHSLVVMCSISALFLLASAFYFVVKKSSDWLFLSRFVKTSGYRFLLPAVLRWPALRFCSISPPPTSLLPKTNTATAWSPISRRAAWPPIFIPLPERVNRPPILHGTGMPLFTRMAISSPSPNGLVMIRSLLLQNWIWKAYPRTNAPKQLRPEHATATRSTAAFPHGKLRARVARSADFALSPPARALPLRAFSP